jgi:hypothetical protein
VTTNPNDASYTAGKLAIVSDAFAAANPEFNNGMFIRASSLGAGYSTGKGGRINPNQAYGKLQSAIEKFGASGAYIHSDVPFEQSRVNFDGNIEYARAQDIGIAMPTADEIKNIGERGGNLPHWQIKQLKTLDTLGRLNPTGYGYEWMN